MFAVQRRDSDTSQWKTCSLKGRKCRYEYMNDARIAYRNLKKMQEHTKIPTRTFRIFDCTQNKEVE